MHTFGHFLFVPSIFPCLSLFFYFFVLDELVDIFCPHYQSSTCSHVSISRVDNRDAYNQFTHAHMCNLLHIILVNSFFFKPAFVNCDEAKTVSDKHIIVRHRCAWVLSFTFNLMAGNF